MRTTLALALRGARCSLWRSRSASVAWPWLAPARRSARVHECKGANRQKGFFLLWIVVCCDESWKTIVPLSLIVGRWYIFVPFEVFIFYIFVWVNYCFCFDMPAKELSTLIRLSRANYSLNFPCFANAVAKVWYTFVECRQWRGCENPFLCPAFLFPWFCQSKT